MFLTSCVMECEKEVPTTTCHGVPNLLSIDSLITWCRKKSQLVLLEIQHRFVTATAPACVLFSKSSWCFSSAVMHISVASSCFTVTGCLQSRTRHG
jgi:hypothetical protein